MSTGAVAPIYWAVFGGIVLLALVLDRLVFGGAKGRVSFREALDTVFGATANDVLAGMLGSH